MLPLLNRSSRGSSRDWRSQAAEIINVTIFPKQTLVKLPGKNWPGKLVGCRLTSCLSQNWRSCSSARIRYKYLYFKEFAPVVSHEWSQIWDPCLSLSSLDSQSCPTSWPGPPSWSRSLSSRWGRRGSRPSSSQASACPVRTSETRWRCWIHITCLQSRPSLENLSSKTFILFWSSLVIISSSFWSGWLLEQLWTILIYFQAHFCPWWTRKKCQQSP